MRETTIPQLMKSIDAGRIEAETDIREGLVMVRDAATGERFTVNVVRESAEPTALQRAVKELGAIELCSDCGRIIAEGRCPCDASVTTRFAVHYPSRSPRHDRWFVLSSFEIETVLMGVAVPVDKYGERLGVEMPAWWTPQRQTILRVKDPRVTGGYVFIEDRYESTVPNGVERLCVNVETGAVTSNFCPACGAPCVYKYCDERVRNAEAFGNDQVFLLAYRDHAERLKAAR